MDDIDGVPIEDPAALTSAPILTTLDGDADMLAAEHSAPAPIDTSTPSLARSIPAHSASFTPPTPAIDSSEMAVEHPSAPSVPFSTSVNVEEVGDTFKVPALPVSTGLNGLPADIEHILSLGANEGDEETALGSTTNYEKVVKDLREKAGFSMNDDGPWVDKDVELESIEKEMQAGGVERTVKVEEQGEDEPMSLKVVSAAVSAPKSAANDS